MRVWVDGCFDFFHHGHAGALNQARALGDELYVGIHTDEEILQHKGPVVMHLDERVYAVDACRWTTKEVSGAPYITDPKVMDEYNCEYVAHGDDITTDANGNDTYQEVKDLHRFLEFKRTPNISTTDLISRMLSQSKSHHLKLADDFLKSEDAKTRFTMYAKGVDAKTKHCGVYNFNGKTIEQFVASDYPLSNVVYTEGAFDLFHCGHIEFLEKVRELATKHNCKVVVGLRSDEEVNKFRGEGLPIMNIFERALCVLQCKHVDAVVLNVPYSSDGKQFTELLNSSGVHIDRVARGPTGHREQDGVSQYFKSLNKLDSIEGGKYKTLTTQVIVDRVLENRAAYEERQRKKGVKSAHEKVLEANEKKSK